MHPSNSKMPKGGRGGTSRVTTKDGESFETDTVKQDFKPDGLMPEHIATVGMSASIGQSTDYSREKYEITAWCSLPVPADDESIKEGYDVAYDYVISELERRKRDVEQKFFPHLIADDSPNKVAKK